MLVGTTEFWGISRWLTARMNGSLDGRPELVIEPSLRAGPGSSMPRRPYKDINKNR